MIPLPHMQLYNEGKRVHLSAFTKQIKGNGGEKGQRFPVPIFPPQFLKPYSLGGAELMKEIRCMDE
jgi:hypothetical protein